MCLCVCVNECTKNCMRAARALNHLPKLHDATKVKTRFKLADHQTDSSATEV